VSRPHGLDQRGPSGDELAEVGRINGVVVRPDVCHVLKLLVTPACASSLGEQRQGVAVRVVQDELAWAAGALVARLRCWGEAIGHHGAEDVIDALDEPNPEPVDVM
jgi:hypothetical protein